MADVYFKQTEIFSGSYWQVVGVRNVKPEERSRLSLLCQEYRVLSGDIGTSSKRVEPALTELRNEMKKFGHTLHYDPPITENFDFNKEFKKTFRVGTRWLRKNYVNPKAATPIEVTVEKTTPQEAIVRLADGWSSHLTWPHLLGLSSAPLDGGWLIKDSEGRTLVSYMPLDKSTTSESIIQAMLEDEEEESFVAFDLDGTLAKALPGKYHPTKIGEPVPKMVAKLRHLVSHGKKVKIFTARAKDAEAVEAIRKWLKDNELPDDIEITNIKEPAMDKFYDDRAIGVQKNTGELKDSLYADFPWEAFLTEAEETWEPSPHVIAWFQNMLRMLKPMGEWVVPATGQVYEIDKPNRTVTLVAGGVNDPDHWHEKTKAVFQKLGYTVHDEPPRQPG